MEDKLNVAIVLKPQGIRGEVKVKALCDSAEDLKGLKRVFIDGVEYGVLGVRAQGETGYISLKGIFDRNAAEHLRGKDIFALRDDMPPLPEDRFYIADLTGCAVVASSGEEIGEVVSVTPARTDIYTITTTKGEGKEPVLYLDLEEYAGDAFYFQDRPERNLADLLYYFRQGKGNFAVRMSVVAGQADKLDYVLPMPYVQDMQAVKKEEWLGLFEKILSECIYEKVILDLGDSIDGLLDILGRCATVYTPYIEEPAAKAKLNQYFENLRKTGREAVLERTIQKRMGER